MQSLPRQLKNVARGLTFAGAAATAAIPFIVAIDAWPEIVVPSYFVSRGGVLYDTIFFPHTPLLIVLTALLGKTFGFSAFLLRAIVAATMAAAGALIVRGSSNPFAGFFAGIPVYLYWLAAFRGLTFWPDPMLAPLALGAALLLARFERDGTGLTPAGFLLGIAVITKQTSAWLVLASLAWLVFASRRRSLAAIVKFAAAAAAPYAAFAVVWAIVFRTTSHLYWTAFLPLFSGHAGEIQTRFEGTPLLIAYLLIIPVYLLITRQFRSPLPWLAAGAVGMTWPRADVLHVTAATAIVAVLTADAVAAAIDSLRHFRTLGARSLGLVAGVTLLACLLGVMFLTAPQQHWRFRGPVVYWDDAITRYFAAQVRRRIPPNGKFLNVNTPETLYAITGTTTPSGMYVNPMFWYYLNKRGLDQRLCRDLASRHGTPILFTPIPEPQSDATCFFRTAAAARPVESVAPETTWRLVP
jgi:hypothetical protein